MSYAEPPPDWSMGIETQNLLARPDELKLTVPKFFQMAKDSTEPVNYMDWFRAVSHTERVATLRPNIFLTKRKNNWEPVT